MIPGDVRNVACPTCGEVMNGWVAFGPREQVTYCHHCDSVGAALGWLQDARRLYPVVWLARKTQWQWLWSWLDRRWWRPNSSVIKRCDAECWQTGNCTGACHGPR